MGLIKDDNNRYLYILKDGKMREKVAEGTEGAVLRTHTDDDGKTTEKWEIAYSGIKGLITGVQLYDGDYGTSVNVSIKDEDDNLFILSLKAASGYGESFMEALPNIDLAEEVTLKSYIAKKSGRPALFIQQNGETIRSAFSEYNEETKTFSGLLGYPQPDAKTKKKNTSEAWKIFFAMRNEWLKDYLTDNKFIEPAGGESVEAPEEGEDKDSF